MSSEKKKTTKKYRGQYLILTNKNNIIDEDPLNF